jgi:argininosuccinate lyase
MPIKRDTTKKQEEMAGKPTKTMKLWNKGYEIDNEALKFTVGKDYMLDKNLVKYDCIASIAHAKMLKKIGILNAKELEQLIQGLNEIIQLSNNNQFIIMPQDEDCHTAIENYLTQKYGDVGKKIHTARSRNDQVLTALRLYEKDKLSETKKTLESFKKTLIQKIKKDGCIEMPGYTHMQKAMPSSVGLWLGQFVESTEDNIKLLDSVISIIDKSPLGTGAGFGVPCLNVDKKMTSKLMAFKQEIKNPLYAQLSRGKHEATVIHSLSNIMIDLNKIATDMMMLSMKEFSFIEIPIEYCTGSSIMPQKKNPDCLEIARANYHVIVGEEMKVKGIISNLISGYNRDLQLTKEPVMNSFDLTINTISIITSIIGKMKINKENCKAAMTCELYATQEANELVKKGMPFRQAYQEIAKKHLENTEKKD